MPALLAEQDGEVERAVGAASRVRAAVRPLGTRDIASNLKQHAKVRGSVTMPELVGLAERVLGFRQPALLGQRQSKIEEAALGIDRWKGHLWI